MTSSGVNEGIRIQIFIKIHAAPYYEFSESKKSCSKNCAKQSKKNFKKDTSKALYCQGRFVGRCYMNSVILV